MPFEDMIDTQLFNCFIETFHINGLTTFTSRLLYKAYGVDYSEFYGKFYEFLKEDVWFMQEMSELRALYMQWMTLGRIDSPAIANTQVQGWNLNHRITLSIHANNKYDNVYELIERFVRQEYLIDQQLIDQLMMFQRTYNISYKNIDKYPCTESFQYDFLGYLQDDLPLNNKVTYDFDFADDRDITFDYFLESIYFGRKRNFGKAVITRKTL